ncbi:MAG: hypothetical protein LW720_08420 [Pirellula sp.]|nr:hypothetical protein [Pirellula sp.]
MLKIASEKIECQVTEGFFSNPRPDWDAQEIRIFEIKRMKRIYQEPIAKRSCRLHIPVGFVPTGLLCMTDLAPDEPTSEGRVHPRGLFKNAILPSCDSR